jgi:hypothetical protein
MKFRLRSLAILTGWTMLGLVPPISAGQVELVCLSSMQSVNGSQFRISTLGLAQAASKSS